MQQKRSISCELNTSAPYGHVLFSKKCKASPFDTVFDAANLQAFSGFLISSILISKKAVKAYSTRVSRLLNHKKIVAYDIFCHKSTEFDKFLISWGFPGFFVVI